MFLTCNETPFSECAYILERDESVGHEKIILEVEFYTLAS